MKKIIALLVALLLVSSSAHTAGKRVLWENYTGSWCDSCLMGTIVLDEYKALYPGRVIGVDYHLIDNSIQTDGMQINEGLSMFKYFNQSNVANVPALTIDRIISYNKILFKPDAGQNSTDFVSQLVKSSPIDISLNWYYDDVNKKIIGTIKCDVLEDSDKQLAFQVIICENNVTGAGSQFDQINIFAGNPDYRNSPYHDSSYTLVGYIHNRVARAILGGVAGNIDSFPSKVKAGESYKWDFSTDVPTVYAGNPVKIEDVFLVGVIGERNQGFVLPVLNCVESLAGKTDNALFVDGYSINCVGSGEKSEFKFILDNTSNENKTYNISLIKDSLNPEGWSSQIVGGENSITVQKSSKSLINIEITPNENVGSGIYKLLATDDLDTNNKLSAQVDVVHTGTERLYYYYSLTDYDRLRYLLHKTGYDKFAGLCYLKHDKTGFSKLKNISTVIISCGDNYALDYSTVYWLNDSSISSKGVLIDGTMGLCLPGVQGYLNSMGFYYSRPTQEVNAKNEFEIFGEPQEYVSDGMNITFKKDKQYPSVFLISDTTIAKQIFSYKGPYKKYAGIASIDEYHEKLIALGFSIGNMTDEQQKIDLLKKSIYWLENQYVSIKPLMIISGLSYGCLNFEDTEIGKSSIKHFTISNKGMNNLIIDSLNFTGYCSNAFICDDIVLPQSIPMNEDVVITVKFTPTEEEQCYASLKISSNDPENPKSNVTVGGRGVPNSVVDEGIKNDYISYTNETLNISSLWLDQKSIKIYNILGNIIYENVFMKNLDIDVSKYKTGIYFVVLESNGEILSRYKFIKQ